MPTTDPAAPPATTLDDATIRALADELRAARRERRAIGQFSRRHPSMTIDDGYAVQRAWVALEVGSGRRVLGHKIGLTSKAMQRASRIDEPDFAPLMDDMFFDDGADVPAARFVAPRVEVELAFVLARPLAGPRASLDDVLAATAHVRPAIEIIDARIEAVDRASGAPRTVVDTISDFAACAGVVLGGRAVRPDEVDLRRVGAILERDGVVEETGLAAGVLGHPAIGVAWLAERLARHGQRLDAGEVVLCGSFTRPVPAAAGDAFVADYGPLGALKLRFV